MIPMVGSSPVLRNRQRIPNPAANGPNASPNDCNGRPAGGSNSTRMKKTRSMRSVCCCASTMFAPFSARKPEIAATMPGRSGQSTVRIALQADWATENSAMPN
jgi:hypothetical protein